MNIVRISRIIKHSALLLSLVSSSFLLSACGGSDNKSTAASSSSIASSSTHTFSSTPITPALNGTWPDVKISASGTKTLSFQWSPSTGATYYKLFKKADSTSSYQQVGNNISTPISENLFGASDAVSVHLADWVNSRYKVQACDDSGCVDSTEIVTNSAMLSAITYIKASNANTNDWFGWSVAISGDGQTLVVGAPGESSNAIGVNQDQTSNTSPNSGAVYVFTKVDGNWQQQAYLKASNTEQPNTNPDLFIPNDRFGYQVAISTDGNTLAVSALLENSPSRGINCDQNDYTYTTNSSTGHSILHIGAVYIFKRDSNVWAQTTYVKPHNPTYQEYFGGSLSISGDGKTIAVGTLSESTNAAGVNNLTSSSASSCINFSLSSISSNSSSSSKSSANSSALGGTNSGAVYLFKETDSGWIEESFIKASDANAYDYFGGSVALSNDGNVLAVGAVGEDSKDSGPTNDTVTVKSVNYALNNGGVYLFERANNLWSEKTKVKPYNNGLNQQFGYGVALSGDGNTLAVGTPGDWSKGKGVESITAGVNGALAFDYNLEGDTPTNATGAVYIFANESNTWTAKTYLKASNAQTGYLFGSSVALSNDGRTLAVGSVQEPSQATGINGDSLDAGAKGAGAAYIFVASGSTWEQKSYVKAPNTHANDRFGNSISLDDTGETFAVGAHRESSNATGINGVENNILSPASGAVYLY